MRVEAVESDRLQSVLGTWSQQDLPAHMETTEREE